MELKIPDNEIIAMFQRYLSSGDPSEVDKLNAEDLALAETRIALKGADSRFVEAIRNKRKDLERKEDKNKESETKNQKTVMKVFISWSGEPSHQIALAIRNWLPTVLPYIEPWVSSKDIRKGARWMQEIGSNLEQANFGIFCIVQGNIDEPWVNFEAGAISKSLEHGKVAPVLFNVQREEVTGPLGQFQSTIFDENDIEELVNSINSSHSNPIDKERVKSNLRYSWKVFSQNIFQILDTVESKTKQVTTPSTNSSNLNQHQIDILLLLSKNDGSEFSDRDIARLIDQNVTRTNHYLRQLDDLEYVYVSHNMYDGITSYSIADNGRAYLVEYDLV